MNITESKKTVILIVSALNLDEDIIAHEYYIIFCKHAYGLIKAGPPQFTQKNQPEAELPLPP